MIWPYPPEEEIEDLFELDALPPNIMDVFSSLALGQYFGTGGSGLLIILLPPPSLRNDSRTILTPLSDLLRVALLRDARVEWTISSVSVTLVFIWPWHSNSRLCRGWTPGGTRRPWISSPSSSNLTYIITGTEHILFVIRTLCPNFLQNNIISTIYLILQKTDKFENIVGSRVVLIFEKVFIEKGLRILRNATHYCGYIKQLCTKGYYIKLVTIKVAFLPSSIPCNLMLSGFTFLNSLPSSKEYWLISVCNCTFASSIFSPANST